MDYYQLLGLNKNASPADIKSAYRKQAMQHHPDKGGDAQQFAKINEAYDTLKDPQRKAAYDSPPQQQFNFRNQNVPPGFEEMFRGFGFDPRRPMRNKSITIAHTLTLLEVFEGKTIIANYKLHSGRQETLEINIPPGVQHNDTVSFGGYGDDSINGIPRGDLMLRIRVKNDPIWQRDGDNLMRILDVDIFDCILGGKMDFRTLDDRLLSINIPPATDSGTVLSIGGYGLPNHQTRKRGNIYIKIKTKTPRIKSKGLVKQLRSIQQELNK